MKKLQLLALTMLLSISVTIIPSAGAKKESTVVATTKSDMIAQGANYDYDTLINKLYAAQSEMTNIFQTLIQSISSMQSMQKMKADASAKQAVKAAPAKSVTTK